jgi:hypothetical protein
METIAHMLGICGDHNLHTNLISLLTSETQYALSYIKNYFKI